MSVSTRRQLLFKRVPPTLIAGGIILVFYFLVALTAPFWAPYDYGKIMTGKPQSGPTARNLFGTDQLGRDIFSRVVLGARVDLSLALSATALGVILGGIIGLTIGYLGGWIDEVVMRVIDMIISIPPLILALLVLSGFGSSPLLLVITVGLTYAPRVVRTARAAALSVITEDFITAAKARGESVWSIVVHELLPNATGPLFVEFAIRSGFAVIMIGSLGFLGFGIKPPTPEWGLMISESRNAIFAAPWTVVFPAIVMAVLVMALNLTTEGLARVLGHGFQREAT
jgi:peptide/nickel transport system permease protein